MIGYVTLGTNDFARAVAFYDAIAADMGVGRMMEGDTYVKAPSADILGRMQGNFDFGNGRKLENSPLLMKFWRDNASFPYKSHDKWFVTENTRWGTFAEADLVCGSGGTGEGVIPDDALDLIRCRAVPERS